MNEIDLYQPHWFRNLGIYYRCDNLIDFQFHLYSEYPIIYLFLNFYGAVIFFIYIVTDTPLRARSCLSTPLYIIINFFCTLSFHSLSTFTLYFIFQFFSLQAQFFEYCFDVCNESLYILCTYVHCSGTYQGRFLLKPTAQPNVKRTGEFIFVVSSLYNLCKLRDSVQYFFGCTFLSTIEMLYIFLCS